MAGLKILITSGATREPIDDVRYISNVSTGKTGAKLAAFFHDTGFDVTYARGEGAAESSSPVRVLGFADYRSLDELLKKELARSRYFAVIHLAAVADYSIQSVMVGGHAYSPDELRKIDSGEELSLVLRKNSKILDRLKEYSKGALVVGFKLTNTPDPSVQRDAIEKVASSGQVDLVVHNDLRQIREGVGHSFQVYSVRGAAPSAGKICVGVEELGTALIEKFREKSL